MRFAILGTHPDGLQMADALAASGRHQLFVHTAAVPPVHLSRWGAETHLVGDLEEVLADPEIEAVIVAGSAVNRAVQLRRALQSERHVLCVHPADEGPDVAYEAAMIQRDTRRVLLPLLGDALHPGVLRLAGLCCAADGLGGLRLIEVECAAADTVLVGGRANGKLALPGWDVLRRLGGEVAEVTAYAEREELALDAPLFLSGRFERGGLFRTSLLPRQPGPRWRLTVTGEEGRAELTFPQGCPGSAVLSWQDGKGAAHEETWETWAPWPALVEVFEAALMGRNTAPNLRRETQRSRAALHARRPEALAADALTPGPTPAVAVQPAPAPTPLLSWQDEVRCLELDDAARRSVERRRVSTLEYPDATEEAGVKGTMTLIGCGLLWLILLLVILSMWVPWLGWAVGPVLFFFLALQVVLWLVSRGRGAEEQGPHS